MLIHRSLRRISTSQSLVRYVNDRSVPHRTPEDVVAIIANCCDSKLPPVAMDILSQRMLTMHPKHAFQIITAIHRNGRKCNIEPDILRDLTDIVMSDFGDQIDSHSLVRSLEMVSQLMGDAQWDPCKIERSKSLQRTLFDPTTTLSTIVRLGLLGLNYDSNILLNRISAHTSPFDLARVAYLTGEHAVLTQALRSMKADTLSFILRAVAAWNLPYSDVLVELEKSSVCMDTITPRDAQLILWASQAAQIPLPNRGRMESIAQYRPWSHHAMYEQYRLKADPQHTPTYPVRVPQVGVVRKHQAVVDLKNILKRSGFAITRQRSNEVYLFDVCVNDQLYLNVVTSARDPAYKIYRRQLCATLPVVDIPLATVCDRPETIHQLVRQYL